MIRGLHSSPHALQQTVVALAFGLLLELKARCKDFLGYIFQPDKFICRFPLLFPAIFFLLLAVCPFGNGLLATGVANIKGNFGGCKPLDGLQGAQEKEKYKKTFFHRCFPLFSLPPHLAYEQFMGTEGFFVGHGR